MQQKEIEMILMRQLASYLAMPIFLVDPVGTLLYYNSPAEKVFGHSFEDTGMMPLQEWGTIFKPFDDDGQPVAEADLPLVVALNERRPAQKRFWICGLDNVHRHLDVIAFPLIGQGDRFLGAAALFMEVPA